MNDKIDWSKVKEEFERDVAKKLAKLPSYREVPENSQRAKGNNISRITRNLASYLADLIFPETVRSWQ